MVLLSLKFFIAEIHPKVNFPGDIFTDYVFSPPWRRASVLGLRLVT
jgi:hypothetical protein